MEPLSRISRHSPASILAEPSPRDTSHSAETMAGASITAATATM